MNTTHRFEQAIEELHSISLTPDEKNKLYAKLREKIAGSAMPHGQKAGGSSVSEEAPVLGVASPWSVRSVMEWAGKHRFAAISVTAFALAVLGGGSLLLKLGLPVPAGSGESLQNVSDLNNVPGIVNKTSAIMTTMAHVPAVSAATDTEAAAPKAQSRK